MGTNHAEVIGIDLGGTAIKLGRFDCDGNCRRSLSIPTPQPPHPEAVLEAIVGAIAQLDPDQECLALGVGTPGPTDAAGRIARVAINLGWQDVPLADWLEARTQRPTVLANDANCAGMGEYWRGAGRPFKDLILLTLGTGVGGAIILNGHLFTGRNGTAGELGLTTLDLQGPACNSGNRGSLEQHVSVQAIRRRTGLEPEELGRRAQAGDAEAIAFWQTYGDELGAGLASLIYVLTPEAIVIGGGICASAEFFFPSMMQAIEQRVLPSSREGLHVLVAELGNQAGMVGAAKLAWELLDTLVPDASCSPLPTALTPTLTHFQSAFLARSSHELRSPLNSIISLLQLILAGLADSPEEEREFIQQAHDSAHKMLGLLDTLIAVSKLQTNAQAIEIQPVALFSLLHEVQQLAVLPAQNRNLRLQVALPDESLFTLADPTVLKQALLLWLDSSIAQMQEGHLSVTTTVEPDTNRILIDLEDERPAETWHDLLDWWKTQEDVNPQPIGGDRPCHLTPMSVPSGQPSPGLSLAIAQILLQSMGGSLQLLEPPTPERPTTRLRCILPLFSAEDV
ncbi:MAG TPA: ROK family protein [Synechococcales cyanobacterium M55_K2018_004]|nr:ROK family protein [Synechococcales cyanobacterium M55_K2018_004]